MTSRRPASLPLAFLLCSLIAPQAGAAPPKVDSLFPAGAGRGATAEVTASGAFERWPVKVWVDEPGTTWEPTKEKGKFSVRVAPDAPPGPRLVRFHDEQGASGLHAFIVGTLPEIAENEPNDAPAKAQEVAALPIVVNGRFAKRGDVDAFSVQLAKGQTLVAALDAQRFGAPMDGVIQVTSPEGFVLDQVDDAPGLDPRLPFVAPADGRYLVRVFAFPSTPDSTIGFAGGDAYRYRLTLTASGYLDRVYPAAVGPDRAGFVEGVGWNIPPTASPLRVEPSHRRGFLRAWHPQLAGVAEVPACPLPCWTEEDAPNPVSSPACISGRIEAPKDEDHYRFALTKGQAVRFQVEARGLGSPLDAVLAVRDEAGNVLAEEDDRRDERDPSLTFTPPADGVYLIAIHDLNGEGSPLAVYRLEAQAPQPRLDLTAAEDWISVAAGQSAKAAIAIGRSREPGPQATLTAVGLPPGVTAKPTVSEPKGDTSKSVTLVLEAAADAPPFSGPIVILGRADGQERTAQFTTGIDGISTDQLWLTVTPKAP